MRNRLRWSVLALAQPADIQLKLFPDFVCKADELALNFEEGLIELVDHEDEISQYQRSAIDNLDRLLNEMSGKTNAAFWTEGSLQSHPIWEEIRQLAKAAVESFGWPVEPPPPSDDIYVHGSRR